MHELTPGQTCDRCQRRVPYPKKETSPKSRTVSLRIPDDGIEEWDDLFVLIAERLGVSTKEPYFKYKALLYAMREALA